MRRCPQNCICSISAQVCIFGWLAAITFDDYDMDNRAGTPVNELFNGLGISIYTTWLIATTADYPDQMLPSYTYARSAGIFFFVYILITVFMFVEAAIPVVGYLYHVSFYIVGILIVKEGLIVAFIVDAFLSQFEDNRALQEDENIASLDQSRAGNGFRIIACKRGTKDDIYRAMFLEDDD